MAFSLRIQHIIFNNKNQIVIVVPCIHFIQIRLSALALSLSSALGGGVGVGSVFSIARLHFTVVDCECRNHGNVFMFMS